MRAGGALVVPVMVLVVGCTPTTPPTTAPSTAAPTFLCTPEAGGAEAPCTQQQYDQMKAKDAQYAEAERVYREFISEYVRVMRAGGARELTPALEALLGDPDLADTILDQLKDFKLNRLRVEGPGIDVQVASRLPGRTMKGSTIAMEFCVDASSMTMYRGTRVEGSWVTSKEIVYFKSPGATSLQMVAGTTTVVRTCD